ncbi:hypothetical protein AB0N62_41885 [Streptomyces sp. NPDC093982]|uniref:hypothetical protein n=1 Tax=Streptomyces sp. NPDC093982 TaxID=3155077 RepID=UPI00343CB735
MHEDLREGTTSVDTRPFDAVLCDFDGVVHLWDPDGMTSLDRAWSLAEGTLTGRRLTTSFCKQPLPGG